MAREQAHRYHLIVTNHSLLAIDADVEGVPMIPDYDVVVIDEAHELVARVTQAATDELAVNDVERASRRSQRHVGESTAADDLADAGDALQLAMDDASPVGSTGCPRRCGTPWCWSGTRPGPACRPTRASRKPERRPGARWTPGGPRPAAWSRRCSSPPSGWRPGPRPTCCG